MLSLLLTTCHRPDLLRLCCQSLQQQEGLSAMEVIIVNNGEAEELIDVAKAFPNFKFIHEPRRGLSLARNTGAEVANGTFLVFLDDDVQFPPGFLRMAQEIVDNGTYAAFGGSYRPWYPYGKPKWLPADFGAKQALRSDRGPIIPGQEGFLSGGVFACRKAVFWEVGGFAPHLGMSRKMGYGEEDDLQLRIHAAGHSIAFMPDWCLEHAVLPHKWRLRWQLHSARARRRDRAIIESQNFSSLLVGSFRTLAATLIKGPWLLGKCIFSPHYYWQNMVLDLGVPLCRRWGDWQAFFRGEGRGARGEDFNT